MPLLGFFGSSAIRMLRESWEGVIPVTTDPLTNQQQVRPVGADLLAQEIFATLNDDTPQTQNAPVTINQKGGAVGLVINSSGQTADPPVLNVTSGNIILAGTAGITLGTPSTAQTSGADIVLTGNSISIPPIGVLNLPATSWTPIDGTPLPTINLPTLGTPSPGQAYMGTVTAHVGGVNYTVSLAGISGTVTASIAESAVGYVVPNGTWVTVVVVDDGAGGVYYEFQTYPFAPIDVSGVRQSLASGGGLTNLFAGLALQGIIVNSTTDTPQTVAGTMQATGTGGALDHLLQAMANIGFIDNSTVVSAPQVISGVRQALGAGGGLANLLTGLANLGIITNSTTSTPQVITGARNDGGATIPALTNLLTGLANLGIITDSTTP